MNYSNWWYFFKTILLSKYATVINTRPFLGSTFYISFYQACFGYPIYLSLGDLHARGAAATMRTHLSRGTQLFRANHLHLPPNADWLLARDQSRLTAVVVEKAKKTSCKLCVFPAYSSDVSMHWWITSPLLS